VPTLTQLTAGLGGAIGSDFRTAQNQLIFVEFATGKLSSLTVAPAPPAFKVLGTGYNQPEDVKLSADGVHAYVIERTGDLVRVALTSANRSAATVIATGMTAPQQLFLDEAHNAAYVVEFAAAGSLLKINLTSGAKTVLTTLNNPVGLVLTSDLQFAYVSEQTTGPDLGRITQIQLSTAAHTTIVTGLTAPFFLTWADAAQDSLLVPQRDPANSIVAVNVIARTSSVVVGGLPFRPSSVVSPYSGVLLVCCDGVIEEVAFVTFSKTAPLLWGIGLIPATSVTAGLATTPAGSLYQVTNSPFGGSLPIIVNNLVIPAGASFYQIKVDGVPQVNTWNAFIGGILTPIPAQTVGGVVGCYPVAGLPGYFPAGIGGVVDSTTLTNAPHTIVIHLLNSTGGDLSPDVTSVPLTILVNNQQCVAVLSPPTVNSPIPPTTPATADACGLLHYGPGTPKSNTVSFPLTATQPGNFATFSLSLYRGPGPVTTTGTINPLSGPVPAASPIQIKLSDLLGPCATAGVAAILYVAANITSGLSRQSQYDAEAVFALAMTT
jgi:hypothetical protein